MIDFDDPKRQQALRENEMHMIKMKAQKASFAIAKAARGRKPILPAEDIKKFYAAAKKAGVRTAHEMNMFRFSEGMKHKMVQKGMQHMFIHKMSISRHHQDLTVHKMLKRSTPPPNSKGVYNGYTVEDLRKCAREKKHSACVGRFNPRSLFNSKSMGISTDDLNQQKMEVPKVNKSASPYAATPDNTTATWEYLVAPHVPESMKKKENLLNKITSGSIHGDLSTTDLKFLADMMQHHTQHAQPDLGESMMGGATEAKKSTWTLESNAGGTDLPQVSTSAVPAVPLFGNDGFGGFEMDSRFDDIRTPPTSGGYGKTRLGETHDPFTTMPDKDPTRPEAPASADESHPRDDQCSPFPRYSGSCFHSCPVHDTKPFPAEKKDLSKQKWYHATARKARRKELRNNENLSRGQRGRTLGEKVITAQRMSYDSIPLDNRRTDSALKLNKKRAKRCLRRAKPLKGYNSVEAKRECQRLDALCVRVSGGPKVGTTMFGSDRSTHPPQLVLEVFRDRRRRDCGPMYNMRTDIYTEAGTPSETSMIKYCERTVADSLAKKTVTQETETEAALRAGKWTRGMPGDKQPTPILTASGCTCHFPFTYAGKTHFSCVPDEHTGERFCAVTGTKLHKDGKREILCGSTSASVMPTGRWDTCNTKQKNKLGAETSLKEIERGVPIRKSESLNNTMEDPSAQDPDPIPDRAELKQKAIAKHDQIPEERPPSVSYPNRPPIGITPAAVKAYTAYKAAIEGGATAPQPAKSTTVPITDPINSLDQIPHGMPSEDDPVVPEMMKEKEEQDENVIAEQKQARAEDYQRRQRDAAGRGVGDIDYRMSLDAKSADTEASSKKPEEDSGELVLLQTGVSKQASPYPGCKLVCGTKTSNLADRIKEARQMLKEGNTLMKSHATEGIAMKLKKEEQKMKDYKRIVQEKETKLSGVRSIETLKKETSKYKGLRQKAKREDVEIMKSPGSTVDQKYMNMQSSAFKEGYEKAKVQNTGAQQKLTMEVSAKSLEGTRKVAEKTERSSKEIAKKETKQKEIDDTRTAEMMAVDKAVAQKEADAQLAVNNAAKAGVESILKEAKQKHALLHKTLTSKIGTDRRAREKAWKREKLKQIALKKKETKLKNVLKSAEYKKKHVTESGEKKIQIVKTALNKLLKTHPDLETSAKYKELNAKYMELKSRRSTGFLVGVTDLSNWEGKKERYGKLVAKFNKEQTEKKAYRERKRKELLMKEASKLTHDEKMIKTRIQHNKMVNEWNLRAKEGNTKRELCRDRRSRNVDVQVLETSDGGFVDAGRPDQAISALPQNENVKNYLKVQENWQYSFIKFALPHEEPEPLPIEEELGEGFGRKPAESNPDATINVIPNTTPRKHSVDVMARRYNEWEALAYQNEQNGYRWHHTFPGQWWHGLTRDEAFDKMASGLKKLRIPVHERAREDTINEQLMNERRRYVIRRRRYVFPSWYHKGEKNSQDIKATVPSRRRGEGGGYVDPSIRFKVLKASMRVFKYEDNQRASVNVELSQCEWTRNTLTWDAVKSYARVKHDKYSHLKRMLFRENKVKLQIRSDPAEHRRRAPPVGPVVNNEYIENDDDDRHATTQNQRFATKPKTKALKDASEALIQVEEGLDDKPQAQKHDDVGESEGESATAKSKANAKAKGLFDGIGYTHDYTDIAKTQVLTPDIKKPFTYDQVYNQNHVTTESTFPKNIRAMPINPANPGDNVMPFCIF